MKTKHLLTALALPAVFAACTAEDIVTEGVSVGQAERIALNENFKMNFGGVESRLDAGKPGEALLYSFEENDMVGGAVIDQFTPDAAAVAAGTKKYEDQYTVIDYVSANQPFTFDGAKWTLEHTMVEGKYLFYYPYNTANNSRGAAVYEIPVMQELSDKATGEFNPKAAVERYGMAVGYQFLSKDDLSASVELAPIFGYARFVLKLDNRYAGGEVEKIVLKANTSGTGSSTVTDLFKLKGQLSNKKIEKLYQAAATDETFDWDDVLETSEFALGAEGTPYYGVKDSVSAVMVGKVPAGVSMTTDAQGNKEFQTYMVMPAQSFKNPITVYLYTKDGRVFAANTADKLTFKRNVPKKVELYMAESSVGEIITIASMDNWNDAVAKIGKADTTTFIIADPEFTLTNDAKYPTNKDAAVKIEGDIKVSGNDVTMKNVIATGSIIVEKGAKLTTDVTTTANAIINKGTVVVAKNPEVEVPSRAADKVTAPYAIDSIANYGTLTINEDAVLGTAWKADKSGVETAVIALTNLKGATVDNAGELTVKGSNNGTINNAGSIYVAKNEEFVNEKIEFKSEDQEIVILNTPTINNAATGKLRADGKFTNNAMLVNNGILSCKNNAGVINNVAAARETGVWANGVVDAKAGSTTYITDNDGKVIVYAMDQANVTTNGTVEYTAVNAAETVDKSIVTDIIATKDLEVKWVDKDKTKSFTNLTVKGNAVIKLTLPTDKTLTLNALTIESGSTTLASDFTVNNLTVKKGAVLNVPATYTLTLNQVDAGETPETLLNKGTISVVGSFVAKDYTGEEEVAGDVEDNGDGTITWKATELDVKKQEFIDAVEDLIKVWVVEHNAGHLPSGSKVSDINYDLRLDSGAADEALTAFIAYYNEYAHQGKALVIDQKLAAYNTVAKADHENKYTTAYTEKTIADGYATAVTEYLKTITDVTTFAETLTTKTVMDEYLSDMATNIAQDPTVSYFFNNDSDTSSDVKSEKNALKAFKDLVVSNSRLNENQMVVLCSMTAWSGVSSYVPNYAFAFETSNIYLILKNYYVEYGFDGTTRNLAAFKNWIETMSGLTDAEASTKQKIVRDYLNANDFAIYKESLKWNYKESDYELMLSHAQSN